MRINDLLIEEEAGWWDSIKGGLSKMMSNNPDEELYAWIEKNLNQKGTQWIYRNVDKQFPKRYVRSDIDNAIKVVMKMRRDR